jgi:hypothetical protein
MSSSSLEVPRRPQPAKRSKLWRILAVAGAVLLVVVWILWYLRTPDDLPLTDRSAEGTGVVDQPVYIGMFAVGEGFDRTIKISDISVDVDADGDVEVTPQLCRDGSLSVTTDASGWCPDLADPEGAEFDAGDSIVLVVTASEATEVTIGRLEISFREGIRWGTKDAGFEGATLTFADHTPGTVDESDDSSDTPSPRPEHEEPTDKKGKKGKKDDRDGRGSA